MHSGLEGLLKTLLHITCPWQRHLRASMGSSFDQKDVLLQLHSLASKSEN